MTLSSSLLYQSGNKLNAEPFVLVGPVIGLVTHSSARVLIETNIECSVTCTVKGYRRIDGTTKPSGQSALTLSCRKRLPSVFEFINLQPETQYKLSLSIPCPGLVTAGFTTLVPTWSLASNPARIGVVTGNNYAHTRDSVEEKCDVWRAIYRDVSKHRLDYVIHVGGNVFLGPREGGPSASPEVSPHTKDMGDNRWLMAFNQELEGLEPREWPDRYDRICDLFRGCYRETWNHPMTKHVLANVPNLMIPNDSELCPSDLRTHSSNDQSAGNGAWRDDPYSAEYFLACCAYEVYNEYQRALYEPYEPQAKPYQCISKVRQTYHFHALGDIGIMALDVRAANTFHHQNEDGNDNTLMMQSEGGGGDMEEASTGSRILGTRQWKDIEYALSDSGYLAGCRMLLVVTPAPIVLVGDKDPPKGILAACGRARPALLPISSLASEANTWEAGRLLSHLFDWRARDTQVREVCILAGGVACDGALTDITDNRSSGRAGDRFMKQFVLMPVSDALGYGAEAMALRSTMGVACHLDSGFSFKHTKPYGLPGGYATVEAFLFYDEENPDYGMTTQYGVWVKGTNASGSPAKTLLLDSRSGAGGSPSAAVARGSSVGGGKISMQLAGAAADRGAANDSVVDPSSLQYKKPAGRSAGACCSGVPQQQGGGGGGGSVYRDRLTTDGSTRSRGVSSHSTYQQHCEPYYNSRGISNTIPQSAY